MRRCHAKIGQLTLENDFLEGALTKVVMQRLHMQDLSGYLDEMEGYTKLSLPAIALVDETMRVNDTETCERKAGTALHEAHLSLAELR